MDRRQVGVIRELFRYPVKSMRGERINEVEVGVNGIIGDRAYALREANGRIVSAKNQAQMLGFRAYYEETSASGNQARLRISLPDGRIIDAQSPDTSAVLSEALGRTVVLEKGASRQHNREEFDLDGATIFGDVPVETVVSGQTAETMPTSWAMLPGLFFDEFNITLLASGTLSHMHKLVGEDAKLDARRFRPNILVETDPGSEGFVEDNWLNGTLEVGVVVKLEQVKRNIRCVMTTHAQADLERDLRIIRAAAQHHQNYVGVGAVVRVPGKVRVGDPIILVSAT